MCHLREEGTASAQGGRAANQRRAAARRVLVRLPLVAELLSRKQFFARLLSREGEGTELVDEQPAAHVLSSGLAVNCADSCGVSQLAVQQDPVIVPATPAPSENATDGLAGVAEKSEADWPSRSACSVERPVFGIGMEAPITPAKRVEPLYGSVQPAPACPNSPVPPPRLRNVTRSGLSPRERVNHRGNRSDLLCKSCAQASKRHKQGIISWWPCDSAPDCVPNRTPDHELRGKTRVRPCRPVGLWMGGATSKCGVM